MITSTKRLLLLLALALLLMPLFAQTEAPPESVNPEFMQLGKGVLQKLLTGDPSVIDDISWEHLMIDNDDIAAEYYECTDDDEIAILQADIIVYLSDLLHYEGDSGDAFGEWRDEMIDGDYYLMGSNLKKNVEMLFEQDDVNHISLVEISIF
jgi:hypothetical protein